jgi:hypothetical protein
MDVLRVIQKDEKIIELLMEDIKNRIKINGKYDEKSLSIKNILNCVDEIKKYMNLIKNDELSFITGARDFSFTLGFSIFFILKVNFHQLNIKGKLFQSSLLYEHSIFTNNEEDIWTSDEFSKNINFLTFSDEKSRFFQKKISMGGFLKSSL